MSTYSEIWKFGDGVNGDLFIELGLYFLLDPSVLDGVFRRDSLWRIFFHKPFDKILHVFTFVSPIFRFEFKYTSTYFCNNLVIVGSSKWWSSAHHNVKDNTNTP